MLLTTITVLTLLAAGQDRLRAQPGPDASRWAAGQPANAPPLYAETDCANTANRAENESKGGCIMRFRRMGPAEPPGTSVAKGARLSQAGGARLGEPPLASTPEPLSDNPWTWFNVELGSAESASASARVEPEPPPAPSQPRCRNVFQRAEPGFGGSFSRVCGDAEPEGPRLLEEMRQRNEAELRDAERDCVRRPVPTDQGVQWTLVCGAPENRDRARDMLNRLMN